ncbi:MAG: TraR/DksA family transcriptional regulator [Gammaproteobacteria bacterium]|nr:TraR/DksA family transcriptional regulator [Gammaproteobacteria bacterium]
MKSDATLDIQNIKKQLVARRDMLRAQLHKDLQTDDRTSHASLSGSVRDRGDESVADLISDLNIAATDRHSEELTAIEETLARIRNQDYGDCTSCGEPIPPSRLLAQPTALYCLDCQAHKENTQDERDSTPSL